MPSATILDFSQFLTKPDNESLKNENERKDIKSQTYQHFSIKKAFPKNVPVRLLGTGFTNAISCFKPGPQEPHSSFQHDIGILCTKRSPPFSSINAGTKIFINCIARIT
jgi:hypothetical protein